MKKTIKIKGSRWSTYTRQEKVVLTAFTVFLCLLVFWIFFPVLFALMNSFKPEIEYNADVLAFPKKWLPANYLNALKNMSYRNKNVLQMFLYSFIQAVTFSLSSLTATTLVAYTLSRFKFKGRNFLISMIVVMSILPIFGTLPATYKLIVETLMIDNNPYIMWITAFSGFNAGALILMPFFTSISGTYTDAARIDGAGNLRVLTSIMLPVASPILLTTFVVTFIGQWNDYMTAMLFMPKYPTLAAGLFKLKSTAPFNGGTTLYFASIMLAALVPLILFSIVQKKIIGASFEGGIKG